MSGGLLRNASIATKLFQRSITTEFTDPITRAHSIFRNQAAPSRSRDYFRSSHYLRKAKDCDVSPSLFKSAFSSSAADSTASKFRAVAWYLGMVKSRPVLTKSITSSLIYVAADISSQTIAQASLESYDLLRTLRMGGYGLLILGPSLHFWFNFVSRLFPQRDLITTFKKMAMGQTLYGPAMTVVFFSTNAFLQGENTTEIIARLKRDLLPTMLNGVMYWPICDFITFKFTPVQLQPLVSNSFSYLWTVYMTYMASQEKPTVTVS